MNPTKKNPNGGLTALGDFREKEKLGLIGKCNGHNPPSPTSTITSDDDDRTTTSMGDVFPTLEENTGLFSTRCVWSAVGVIFRYILLDLPLMGLFALLMGVLIVQYVHDEYLVHQLNALVWTDERRRGEITYYNRICSGIDLSARQVEDLMIQDHFTTHDCFEHMMVHGMSLYSDILREETAEEMRKFILKRNSELTDKEEIPVLANKNRTSFGFGANEHPIVPMALNELATHPVLRPALEKIVGRNPAIIELSAITASFGAADQVWHQDISQRSSSQNYVRSFVQSYSLFIALQDTTAEMGATDVCPGTYQCDESAAYFCSQLGFPVSGRNGGVWKKGSALLINQQSQHRGSAHTDLNAPDRVALIITFAPRPVSKGIERRHLSHGGTYSTRWDMWGHTVNDLADASKSMAQPWATLRSLGLYKARGADWGWDFLSVHAMQMVNADVNNNTEMLENLIENGGFGLPSFLTADMSDKDLLHDYYLKSISLWKSVLVLANVVGAGVHVLVFVILSFTFRKRSFRQTFRRLGWLALRFLFSYGLILLLGLFVLRQVNNSPWAKFSKSRQLFNSPQSQLDRTPSDHTLLAKTVKRHDILIGSRFDSPFLGSYNQLLDYHPGNRAWKKRLDYFAGSSVEELSPILQRLMSEKIVQEMTVEGSDFLVQNLNGDWTLMEPANAIRHTHRALLLTQKDLLLSLDEQLRFLMSECRYGEFQAMVIHERFCHKQLRELRKEIFLHKGVAFVDPLHTKDDLVTPVVTLGVRSVDGKGDASKPKTLLNRIRLIDTVAMSGRKGISIRTPLRIPAVPFSGKTTDFVLKVGAVVESQYRGEVNEWYKGTIVKINDDGLIDVHYDNGSMDFGLPQRAVREFLPFKVGEVVYSMSSNNSTKWYRSKIVSISGNGNFIVKIAVRFAYSVPPRLVRRFEGGSFMIGDAVASKHKGNYYSWYRGVVVAVAGNNTFDIQYHDEHVDYGVRAQDILNPWDIAT